MGGALLALGIVMLLLPGPGLLVIPAALGFLALEFEAPVRWRLQLASWIEKRRRR